MEKLNSRVAKNVIMIVLISGLTVGMLFTSGIVGKHDTPTGGPPKMSEQQNDQNGQLQAPPYQSNQNGGQSGQDSSDQNSQQNGQPQAPPDQSNQNDQNGQPQAPPDQNGQNGGQSGQRSSAGMKVLTGFEALGIAALAVYLIMSGFNKKSFKETMPDKKKAAVFAAATILAGGGLAVAAILIPGTARAGNRFPQQMEQGGPGGQNGQQVEAKGATTVDGDEQTLNDSYESTSEDENAVLVTNGGTLTSDGATIRKKSGEGSNIDSCDFYGVNAGVLVNEDSSATIKNAEISTAANRSNAVFCTGSKSKIEISSSTITTTGESSCRGLDATNGGTIIADDMKITTQGGSCATLATDRGEGTVTVTDSELETNGAGSPLIYSTGDISITKTKGTAKGSQITVVEGKNSAAITDSEVTASGAGNRGDVDSCGVMIYQSMSGDADEGTGRFTATGSKLSIDRDSSEYKTAPMFFVTNTDAEISLTDTKLSFGSGVLLSIKGTDQWGTEGSNGGTVKLTAENQKLKGDIVLDSISEATVTLKGGSSYEGTINGDNKAKSVALTISKDSKVTLTGDTYVSSLEDEDTSYSNIDFNGHKLYVDGKAIDAA